LKTALRGYKIEIIYKKRKQNTKANALCRSLSIEEGQKNSKKPRELYLFTDKSEEEEQDSEKNASPARVMLVKVNRENKRKGKSLD
jgi:hypothetical protein